MPRTGKGSRLPARAARDRCGTPGPPVLTDSWPQESAPRWECPVLAPALGSVGREPLPEDREPLPEASRTLSRGLVTSLGDLETQGLSCSLGRRVASCLLSTAQKGNEVQGVSAPTLVSHIFRSRTFTTDVTQICAEQR